MSTIAVHTENHQCTTGPSHLVVEVEEPGEVYLNLRHIEDETPFGVTLRPDEARALAAVLAAQATEAER